MSNQPQSITYTVTVTGKYQEWRLGNKLHRLDGPAIIDNNYEVWYQEGKRHRLDGPAIINVNIQEWHQNGKLHRLDGPAVIIGKYQAWYIEGKQYTKYQFDEKIKEMNNSPCVNKEVIIDGVTYKLVPKETS